MKRNGILNLGLNQALAAMGHGDLMIICDAGFPIPSQVNRVDLAIVPDVPDLETVIAEKFGYANELAKNNPRLKEKVDRIFADAELVTFPHAEILTELAAKAKFIVRTGAFDPWGNIILYSGVDVPKWFAKAGTVVPEYYASRVK
jgi:D-ribose pyranase